MQDADKLRSIFYEIYGEEPKLITFAPGRVNLIGEHTDYNGGYVLPCALSLGTLCAARPRSDGLLRLCSLNMPHAVFEAETSSLSPLIKPGEWTAYPAGVAQTLLDAGHGPLCGADMLFHGDIPTGAGLSSSASMEVAAALMLLRLNGISMSGPELALVCQRAENRCVGVNCGIMDQFASAMGKRDHAIFLDTASLEYEYVPFDIGDSKLIIVNSRYKHSLADSEYNRRRAECEEALRLLAPHAGCASLCALSPEEFEKNAQFIEDPVILKRARHAVYENDRTNRAVSALRAGGLDAFGRLMYLSHYSLRDDYEVSCPPLDTLVELARGFDGTIGARMTGGGFGGSMVSIVKAERSEEFINTLGSEYFLRTGLTAEFIEAMPGDGVRMVFDR